MMLLTYWKRFPLGFVSIGLLLLPQLGALSGNPSGALGTLSYLGILCIFALSFNVLLGQTGLLSLGHGIFFGLGGFFTVFALHQLGTWNLYFPLPMLPLLGGLGALLVGLVFAWICAKRDGMAFAMISLGLGELVHSASVFFPAFFGGEEGKPIDRTAIGAVGSWDFGPANQMVYVIVGWLIITLVALQFLTKTPFGMLSSAVRENPGRIEYIGFKPHRIRFVACAIAAFFAGIAGSLAALNFEIMTTSDISATQSTLVLLMTYVGGTQALLGPLLGAVVIGSMKIWLSDITPAWQLYLGILFIGVVMLAPGGMVGMVDSGWRFLSARKSPRSWIRAAQLVGATSMVAATLSVLIELAYACRQHTDDGAALLHLGQLQIDGLSSWTWLLTLTLFAIGITWLRIARSTMAFELQQVTHGSK